MRNEPKGSFLAFEGIDGSGKSTQIRMLIEHLKNKQIRVYETREPTDSPFGSLIHQIMTGRVKTDNRVIAGMFVADRLDHLLNDTDGICSKINSGVTVISDRYYFSSYAYQGIDIKMDWVIEANSLSAEILRPTFTIFIDISPEIAIERLKKERFHTELFEKYDRLVEVRNNYFESFEKLEGKENIIIVDGNKEPKLVFNEVWNNISHLFP